MKVKRRQVSNEVIQAIHRLHADKMTYQEIAEAIGFSTWVVGEVLRNDVQSEEEWKTRNSTSEDQNDEPEQIVFQMDNSSEDTASESILEALDRIGEQLKRIADRLDSNVYVKKAYD